MVATYPLGRSEAPAAVSKVPLPAGHVARVSQSLCRTLWVEANAHPTAWVAKPSSRMKAGHSVNCSGSTPVPPFMGS